MPSNPVLWFIIAALGVGTFLIRFLFLGVVGDRELSPWVLRHLRYTAVAILPALVAPLVVWPPDTGGVTDPLRMAAAAATLATGYLSKSVTYAILVGAALFFGLPWILG